MKSEEFINLCISRTEGFISKVNLLQDLPLEKLNWKANAESWSVLECLEHLNLYGDFYIPEIQNQLKKNSAPPAMLYKSGVLGSYFAKSMLPKENMKKMKTFRDKNPTGSNLDVTIERFLTQQHEIIVLLNQAKNANINKTKTAISISKFIRLRLGDTFHFLLNHNERHFAQIDRVLISANSV